MNIRFTSHAKDKFLILKKHGFYVSEEIVVDTVLNPDKVDIGKKGRLIAQKVIDEKHVLRVVYEEKNNEIVIVTFYPGRRKRYED